MWTRCISRASATLLLLLQAQIADAQSFSDKAKSGIVATKGDPHMEAAYRKAKASLGAFLALARQEPPFIISYAVKIPLREGNVTEYVWMSPFVERNGNFIGILNAEMRPESKYKYGQKITFHESDVVDWMYRQEGKMVGNFTTCALLKSTPPDQAAEFRKQQGLDCDD